MYEGYGPGGTAVMLDILTDNRNRTAADVRHLFSKYGGNLGQDGCVAWMFKKKAVFLVEKETFDDEDALMEIVLEAGADDMKVEDEVFEITAEPEAFDAIEAALGEKGIETASAEVTMVPDNTVHLEGKDAEKMQTLIDALEDNDDIQNVYSNHEIDED
jgi:YebC/PmpR family DNA-binding regulatory protein